MQIVFFAKDVDVEKSHFRKLDQHADIPYENKNTDDEVRDPHLPGGHLLFLIYLQLHRDREVEDGYAYVYHDKEAL